MPPNRVSWAPRGARVFLAMQLAGMLLLALSTTVRGPLGLTVTIVAGFVLLFGGIALAIYHSWHYE